ncbi:SDR family NAD(P)-dependent oxidoreductase [Aquabacter sp. P-9]|uniref:SDR family NAD(P)-dependent oxidoreductase n=1 Tax=Aquabacter sediminis TaxID=3029197 RepID=UPI00237D3FA5|nr:SDR family NAD(P)-dependent oxidoreductase [Aquabacter sp. P-9]MDE1569377.1 SDR family NAD(P)-dependent oxidoreductase [Aquabacter sp. P-9]
MSADATAPLAPLAVVTGAARGIGRAVAERLHQEGYRLALLDREAGEVESLAATLSADGPVARAYAPDMRVTAAVGDAFAALARDLGTPDALVNSAGIYPDVSAIDMREEDWDVVLDVNLKGTFFACQAFARLRRDAGGGGAIVNLASTAAFSARAGAVHYAASKGGVVMLTKGLALEWRDLGIRVNAVAPGLIEVREGQVSGAYRQQFLTMIPSGRIGVPADISGVVAFLLSPDAAFMNAECVVVDGGFLAGRPLQRAGTPNPAAS